MRKEVGRGARETTSGGEEGEWATIKKLNTRQHVNQSRGNLALNKTRITK
jgi:hypothetical protein